jgi:hypothetical protein
MFQEMKAAHREILLKIEQGVWEGALDKDFALTCLAIRDRLAELDGLNAPSKHVTATVDLNETAQGLYPQFMRLMKKRWNQWDKIEAFVNSLPRDGDPLLLEGESQ